MQMNDESKHRGLIVREITLGSTGITTIQNAFGALPIQRVSDEEAVAIMRAAFDGGMRYFDTARAYSDSEHKIALALGDVRDQICIAGLLERLGNIARNAPDRLHRHLPIPLRAAGMAPG